MTDQEAVRIAALLADYASKATSKSVSYWLDVNEIHGEDRKQVIHAFQHCYDVEDVGQKELE